MAGTSMKTNSSSKMTIHFDTFVDEFDSSNFSVTEPKVDKDGRTQFTLLYNGGRVNLETPWFYLPFAPSRFSETSPYTMRLTDRPVRMEGTTEEEYEVAKERSVQWFKNLGESLTDTLLDYGVTHSEVIFGEEYERPVVKALFSNAVKKNDYGYFCNGKLRGSFDDQDTPNVELYVQHPSGKYTKESTSTFDELIEALPKSSRAKAIIFPTLWAVSGKFGISWNVRQILLKKRVQRSFTGFAFSDALEEATEAEAATSETYDDEATEEDADELELED